VALRALLLAIDMVFVFYAFTKLPLADAYTMLFTAPMLVTALSVPLLGERVGWRRWSAVAVGFGGVLVVLRPGFAELNLGHIAALASSSFFALSLIVARRIGNSETGSTLLISLMAALLIVSGPALPAVYVSSSLSDLAMLAGLGLLMGLGHLGLIQALRLAPSNVVAPFHYSQIVWAVIFGLLLFGDRPSAWVIAGSTIIIASGLYILWRETVRRRQAA
jgi:S-adenosylmethionine uptake transporter